MRNVLLTAKSSTDRTDVEEVYADPFTNALVVIDEAHSLVHQGRLFILSGTIASLAAGATANLLGVTDGQTVHFREATIQATGAPVDVSFYEGATVSATGTPLTSYNKNRLSSIAPTLLTYSGPTITDFGTLLETGLIPISGPSKQEGTASLFGIEWVLNSGTNYIVSITNNDSQTISVGYNFLWYEV